MAHPDRLARVGPDDFRLNSCLDLEPNMVSLGVVCCAGLGAMDRRRWLFLGIVWLIWMFTALGSNLTDTVVTRKDAHFISHGPYRYVRNPMYTGILLVGASLGLALGTWLIPLAATMTFCLMAARTRTEEAFLIARFGDQYRNYMTRVGRFFPRLS